MPHLKFEISKKVSKKKKMIFVDHVKSNFRSIMQTGSDHIAVTVRDLDKNSIHLGRVRVDENLCLMNLDIREGRSKKQKRELVKNYINAVEQLFKIKKKNQYAVITEHKGFEFQFVEKTLKDWKRN